MWNLQTRHYKVHRSHKGGNKRNWDGLEIKLEAELMS